MMIKFFTKRYLLGVLNGLMETRKDKISSTIVKINKYEQMLKTIVQFLDSIKNKITDGELSADEIDLMIDEGTTLVEDLFKKD